MKTELLVQMDGLAKTDDLVFLLAASNLPWYVLTDRQLVVSVTLQSGIIIELFNF